MKRIKYHYGRALPLIVFATLAYFMTGTVSSIMNVSVNILQAKRGWNATILTASMSIASLANVVLGFVAGRMAMRGSAKKACAIWGALYCVGIVAMGFSDTAGAFIVAMVVANAASSAWGYNTVPVIITNWFPTKKGTVQGFASMGILFGSFSTLIYNITYNRFGLQFATMPFAIIAGVALLLMMVAVTDAPEQSGFVPDTMERIPPRRDFDPTKHTVPTSNLIDEPLPDRTVAHLYLRNPKLILMTVVLGFQLIFAGGIMVQVVPRLLEVGFSMDEATTALIVASLCAAAGSFFFGVIGDRFGADLGVKLSFAVGAVAATLNLLGNPYAVYASLILIGIVVGVADNWPVNIFAELFGREGFSEVFGVMNPLIQLIGAAGPACFALIANATGSYDASYAAAAVMMAVGLMAYSALSTSLREQMRRGIQ